ncbi:amino acid aldolase or racemase [Pyrenophora tritici-repentis]|nr:amino acid aldolase or racemase [Pyrenophora tritici-repentis]KAI0581043.1 amino acid aldolase or racemase [Pyrenophora tritici-repentis]KAI0609071.1 amino acid aldolase or racemase [Pyrenophora tritici-repentis]KAI1534183.1 amino acid aldolase or racemase [Pyrenophora tritici-repentis]KAI1547916.1 amino acid aldolase or racemase [Pyrenophora tritici-repentis]
MASPTTPLYPLTPTSLLTSHFIGKKLSTLPTPAIVLDRALIRRNCAAMLGICSALGVEFRAHVKSHKTIELSRMQILYGVPVAQSSIPRLISLATELAPGSIHVLIDNLDAFTKLCERLRSAPEAVQLGIFIKIDTGYERAGIKTSSPAFPGLVQSIVAKTQEPGSKCFLKGFYSHFGHSYGGSSEDDAAMRRWA